MYRRDQPLEREDSSETLASDSATLWICREIRQTVLENPSNVPGADTFRSFALPIAMRQSGQTAGSLGFEIAGTEIVHPIRAGGWRTALKTALSSTLIA
jgi:hypothetical protein